jgi:2'-5' RNA ligase
VRLFVALDIPEPVRAAIGALVERLRPVCRAAQWARINNAHITLKFIGEASQEKLEEIKTALAHIHIAAPIDLIFRGAGFFPAERRPRVLWAGIEAGAELTGLVEAVETTLEPLGIAREQRAFLPHLTLARFESPRGLRGLQEAIAAAGPLEFGHTMAIEFHLYQSVLKQGGAEYTRLATYRFAEGGPQ